MGLALSAANQSLWNTIHSEAVGIADAEPALAAWMHEAIVHHSDFAGALAQLIAVATGVGRNEKALTRQSDELARRLESVLQSLYLLFNEGYKASSGVKLVREELCYEAIRLTELLAQHRAGNQPKTHALLARVRM